MKCFAISALLTYVAATPLTPNGLEQRFHEWSAQFNRSFNSAAEHDARLANWLLADSEIQAYNSDPSHTFELGHNQFSDWSRAEYESILLPDVEFTSSARSHREFARGTNAENCAGLTCGSCTSFDFGTGKADSSFDWLAKSNPIVDQGGCGSCWSFSDIANAEIENAIANPSAPLVKLSEQHILNCNGLGYNCRGGIPQAVYSDWLIPGAVKFILASDYPYTAKNGKCVESTKPKTNFKAIGWSGMIGQEAGVADVPTSWTTKLNDGPISVWIAAGSTAWQRYKSGILNDVCCGLTSGLNHAVVIVGWGVSGGQSYWLIRNSWGTSWGESGYIRLQIQTEGQGMCKEMYRGFQVTMATV